MRICDVCDVIREGMQRDECDHLNDLGIANADLSRGFNHEAGMMSAILQDLGGQREQRLFFRIIRFDLTKAVRNRLVHTRALAQSHVSGLAIVAIVEFRHSQADRRADSGRQPHICRGDVLAPHGPQRSRRVGHSAKDVRNVAEHLVDLAQCFRRLIRCVVAGDGDDQWLAHDFFPT